MVNKLVNSSVLEIPVVFITDDKYVIPTATAIVSLLDNKNPDTKYHVYIITTSLNADNLLNFQKLATSDVYISVIQTSIGRYADLHKFEANGDCVATSAALLKFEIPNFLSNYEKAIYLDGDILVRKDLTSLFMTDISNYLAAAVQDTGKLYLSKDIYKNIPNYFNSGVMLLNLERMRRQNVSEKLYEVKKNSKDMSLMDQNIFNIVFKDAVKMLDVTYNLLVVNLMRSYGAYSISDVNKLFNVDYKSLEEIEQKAFILHFSSKDKPWIFYDGKYSKLWNLYFKKTPYKNIPLSRKYLGTDINAEKIEYARQLDKRELIISLASYPARIDTVHQVIESLLKQSVKADKIVLQLTAEQFPNRENDLPEQLRVLIGKKLEIDYYDKNLRSFTKLIPALRKYPEAIVVTADDDILYPEKWLEQLLCSYYKNPNAIHCHRAHKFGMCGDVVLSYNKWEKSIRTARLSYANFLTGVGGVLYPPHCLYQDVLNEETFMELCPRADDIWFWAMAVLNDTKIQVVENNMSNLTYVPGTQEAETCLWRTNTGALAENDIQLKKVLAAYPEILPKVKEDLSLETLLPVRCVQRYYLFGIPLLKVIEK